MHEENVERTVARSAPWAIGACIIWSTAFPAVKIGLEWVDPLTFAGWRFILAGVLLAPFCGSPRKYLSSIRQHWRVILSVSILQTTISYGLFFMALEMVAGAKAAIVIGSSPLVCAVMAHWLMHDDRMTWSKTGAIVLGMAGVVVLAVSSKPWSGDADSVGELIGLGLMLIGMFSSGMAGIVVARYRGSIKPVMLNSAQMGLGGVMLAVIALITDGPPVAVPPAKFFIALTWLAAVSSIGFSIWFALLRHVKVSYLNMWKFLIPVFGAAFSWILLPDESPSVVTVVGMLSVAAAVLLAQLQSIRERR